jgi:hypothetical protein
MSDDLPSEPINYQVSYSQYVLNDLRDLLMRARRVGRGQEFLAAARQIHERLRVFPQFGEPLMDLTHESGQIWHGIIGLLVVRYTIY